MIRFFWIESHKPVKIEAFFATEDAPEFTAVEKSMYRALSSPQNSYKFPVIRSVMEQAEKVFCVLEKGIFSSLQYSKHTSIKCMLSLQNQSNSYCYNGILEFTRNTCSQ